MADDQGELRAAASKAEARLDALEQAVFKERDEVREDEFFFFSFTNFSIAIADRTLSFF